MGWLSNLFTGRSDEQYLRVEPTVTEFPSFEQMVQSYDGWGWEGNGFIDWGHNGNGGILRDVERMTPARLYGTQHQLRQVTTFIARNVAQLGVHSFRRVGEDDRKRDRKNAFATSLFTPDDNVTDYELIYDLVMDLLLYDQAYWWVVPRNDGTNRYRLRRLPPAWVGVREKDPWTVEEYIISDGERKVTVPPEQMFTFHSYGATRPGKGSSPIESLRAILGEQLAAQQYRGQVWARGGRFSSVLTRPVEAPRWSPEARRQFRSDWKDYAANGPLAGATPILEDGMEVKNIDFSAKEQQFIEGATLSLSQVAGAYHINPTMLGATDGATYSNVREFRRMLYGDSLGPLLAQIEARLNAVLLPMLGVDNAKVYVEFNIKEKLQGSFEEQTKSLQASVGAAWMTRNEARKTQNLPAVEGGDELITPLNVLIGSQANPQDSATQNEDTANPVNPPDAF